MYQCYFVYVFFLLSDIIFTLFLAGALLFALFFFFFLFWGNFRAFLVLHLIISIGCSLFLINFKINLQFDISIIYFFNDRMNGKCEFLGSVLFSCSFFVLIVIVVIAPVQL
jgi:hypothetical protein